MTGSGRFRTFWAAKARGSSEAPYSNFVRAKMRECLLVDVVAWQMRLEEFLQFSLMFLVLHNIIIVYTYYFRREPDGTETCPEGLQCFLHDQDGHTALCILSGSVL